MKQSTLEQEFATRARQLGLSGWTREHPFAKGVGRRFRFDFAWPDEKVAVEVEGGVYSRGRHVRGKGFIRDCEKMNLATELGWRVLRYTGEDIRKRPVEVMDQVRRVLEDGD